MNILNLKELTKNKKIKIAPTKAVKSFVVGYYVDEDGFAVNKSGERIETFPGELLIAEQYEALVPYDRTHKGRACVELKDEKGRRIGLVYRGGKVMRYLLTEVVTPYASAGMCSLLATLLKHRQREMALALNDLPLVGLRDFKRDLAPVLKRQEEQLRAGKARTFESAPAKAQKEPKQRYHHRPTTQEVGPRTLARDMCD